MDAITRVSYYFPTHSLASFWVLSNLVINNQGFCMPQERQLMIALIVLFCILVIIVSFTDTYTATNKQKYAVLIIPIYGPVCFSLPTDYDKDKVYEHFYLKIRDYMHALFALAAFLLIVLFINPISMCLFPGELNGSSKFDSSIIRTVPVVVSIITALLMMCLGPPRQMLGYQNVEETGADKDVQKSQAFEMGDNPIYSKGYGPGPIDPSVPEGGEEEDYEAGGHVPHVQGPGSNYSAQHSAPIRASMPNGHQGMRTSMPRGMAANMGPRDSMMRESMPVPKSPTGMGGPHQHYDA
mmetsp:Transcript_40215/g.89249  ORF Transcript_40215/g.89249 Transcript_40215/m.89249 type:complete len:296 (+) Transcript_40215:396-1283(+)|eukprot:CAMPEP_0202891594 /NCGR_PEP_ID=MMETSP1392-20130828/1613_1 /ASSEMBLY_ACC=CAM_ASM_000868 /TAXON_ID=225041 /ORGANISM="Chlamydomonas chlamydogama, Strain SAG 11-48b" /LENGTH=295 /DNA_ID=CAMNT_0049575393 /DNA_START=396 /DNA_END=1283 /DNA_ORIENTATION=+